MATVSLKPDYRYITNRYSPGGLYEDAADTRQLLRTTAAEKQIP